MVDVPFTADEALLEVSAREHGVLWTPMASSTPTAASPALRLSCSYLDAATVEEGVRRLAAMIRENIPA